MEAEAEAGEEWVLRRVAEEITCPMCVNLPRNRVQRLRCGHIACSGCISKLLSSSWWPKCPLCQSYTTRRTTVTDNRLSKIAAEIVVALPQTGKTIDENENAQTPKLAKREDGVKREDVDVIAFDCFVSYDWWHCGACMLLNEEMRRSCKVCGQRKPDPSMLVRPKKEDFVSDVTPAVAPAPAKQSGIRSSKASQQRGSKRRSTPRTITEPGGKGWSSSKRHRKSAVTSKPQSMRVATSGLGELQAEVAMNVEGVGAQLVDIEADPSACTHLVVGIDSVTGLAKRTSKFLTAAAFGVPIVSQDWALQGCPSSIDRQSHIPRGDSVSGEGGPARLLKRRVKPLIGIRVRLTESDNDVNRKRRLAEAAGADVVIPHTMAERSAGAQEGEKAREEGQEKVDITLGTGAGCLPQRWLFDSIALQATQPTEQYIHHQRNC